MYDARRKITEAIENTEQSLTKLGVLLINDMITSLRQWQFLICYVIYFIISSYLVNNRLCLDKKCHL